MLVEHVSLCPNYRLSLLHKSILPFFAERSASNKKAVKLTTAELNSFMLYSAIGFS